MRCIATPLITRLSPLLALAMSLVAAWSSPRPVAGQLVGVRTGVSITNIAITAPEEFRDDIEQPDSRVGLAIGIFYEVPTSGVLGFQAEAAYVQKGIGEDNLSYNQDYLEFSPLGKISTGGARSMHIFAGPTLGVLLSDDEDGEASGVDFGVKGGAGVAMLLTNTRLSLELSYVLGLSRRASDPDPDWTTKHRAFLIQAGVAMPIG